MNSIFYTKPRLLMLTVLLIVVAGLSSYATLPRKEDPSMVARVALVLTEFPGASAERVEALVTEKIEDELRDIQDIKLMRSTSRGSMSVINIQTKDNIDDPRQVWAQVREKLDQAETKLPSGVKKPDFDPSDTQVDAYTMITALQWDLDAPVSYAILRRLAKELEDRLQALPGTQDSKLFGEPDEEIVVEVNPARLAFYGLTAGDLARAIGKADAKAPAGRLHATDNELLIEVAGELDSLERVRQCPVLEGQDGQVVRVSDLGLVRKTIADPASESAIIHGRAGVAVGVRMRASHRIDEWSAQARAVLDEFKNELPRGISLSLLFDQSKYTRERLHGLENNLLLGGFFVLLITFFMMGLRPALMVGLALPLSCLMVLAGLNFMGTPLHQISVTGLIVALGLLIDTAIITVHEVNVRLAEGRPPAQAVGESIRHLFVPLLGSTITTVLAFMPLVIMPGPTGEFVGTLGMSVILALFSSLFVSLAIIAPLTGLLSRGKQAAPPATQVGAWLRTGFSLPVLNRAYRATLGVIFARPILGVILGLSLPTLGFISGGQLEEQFFPPSERDQLQIKLTLPSQASLKKTETMAHDVRDMLLQDPDIKDISWFVGSVAPKFYYNFLGGQNNSPFLAQAMVQLSESAKPTMTTRRVQQALDSAFPEAQFIVKQLEQGPPFDAPIELHLYGPDLPTLAELGEQLRAELSRTPDVIHTSMTLKSDRPKIWFNLSEEEARIAGLSNTDVATQLRDALDGAMGGSILEGTEELPVRVRLAGEQRGSMGEVASLELVGRQGRRVPISAVGNPELTPEFASITRRDGERSNTVQAFVTAGVLPAKVLKAFQQRLEEQGFTLPHGYRMSLGGESEKRNESMGNLAASAGMLLVLMLATLVLSFNSFRSAAIIACVALMSAGLGMGSLFLFGYSFGFMAIVGAMGLIGVAVNDSIVVLAAVRENPAARGGDREAIADIVMHCTRHVLSTSLTTVAGFLPLILSGGGFWPPLAISIAGGVVGATLLGLYFTPSAYVLLLGRRKKVSRKQKEGVHPHVVAQPV